MVKDVNEHCDIERTIAEREMRPVEQLNVDACMSTR